MAFPIPYSRIPGDLTAAAPVTVPRSSTRMLDSVEITPAPLRLTPGSDAYRLVHDALTDRLERLHDAREPALSAHVDGFQREALLADQAVTADAPREPRGRATSSSRVSMRR